VRRGWVTGAVVVAVVAVVLGAVAWLGTGTNARAGARDATVAALARALPLLASCNNGPSTAFFFRFDFLFTSFDPSSMQNCRTLRDEYGSDHRPLILSFDIAPEP